MAEFPRRPERIGPRPFPREARVESRRAGSRTTPPPRSRPPRTRPARAAIPVSPRTEAPARGRASPRGSRPLSLRATACSGRSRTLHTRSRPEGLRGRTRDTKRSSGRSTMEPVRRTEPPRDKRIVLGFSRETIDRGRLVPEPFRPRVRDLGREDVAQEVLLRLMVSPEDPRGRVLADPTGHEREDRLPPVRNDEARVSVQSLGIRTTILFRTFYVEHLVLIP